MTWRSPFTPPPQPVTQPVAPAAPRARTFITHVNGRLVVDMLKGKQEVPK